jgi:hypothetical protein
MRLVVLLVATACAACAREQHVVKPVPTRRPPEPEKPAEFSDKDWEDVRSLRHSLELPLPARAAWTLDDRSDPWFVARHEATSSELRARIWTAPRLVQPAECEAQARRWRPELPPSEGEAAVVNRELTAPEGYRGQVVAGVLAEGGGLRGYALAIGAAIGRCYAAEFTTHASGTGAEQAIGRRLATMIGGVFARVRVRGIDERALDARPPSPP